MHIRGIQFAGRTPGTPQKKSHFQKFHFILELALKKVVKVVKVVKPALQASSQKYKVVKFTKKVVKFTNKVVKKVVKPVFSFVICYMLEYG